MRIGSQMNSFFDNSSTSSISDEENEDGEKRNTPFSGVILSVCAHVSGSATPVFCSDLFCTKTSDRHIRHVLYTDILIFSH